MPVSMSGTPAVVQTGSPVLQRGGGKSAPTGSPTSFNEEVWRVPSTPDAVLKPASEEAQRKGGFRELHELEMARQTKINKANNSKRSAEAKAWADRQKARQDAEAAEQARAKELRKLALQQNRKDTLMDEPGYGPDRWTWPKAHHHPRHCNGTGGPGVGENDVLLTSPLLQPGGMVLSPAKDIANDSLLVLSDRVLSPQQGERFLLELADALPDQLLDMKERCAATAHG